jgi:toxin ParE1/3/4
VRVIFTPSATRQLAKLHNDITLRASESRADAYIGRIEAYCMRLETFPERGTKRDDLLTELRTIGFERCVTIAFVVTDDAVLIEGVFYGGQDFEAELQKE